MVPQPGNSQSFNRYSYGLNNPVKYTDPTGHDVFVIPGLNDEGDYEDPKSYEEWIKAYLGDEKYNAWYDAWTQAETKDDKAKVAKEYGAAIFDWGGKPLNWGTGADRAAKWVQAQIDEYGLKDVTIVGHSKGASTAMALLDQYKNGWTQRGEVKNIVLIDPPTMLGGILNIPAPWAIDAKGANVNTVVLPGAAACLGIPCAGPLQNASVVYPYQATHDLRNNYADDVFYYALNVKLDEHANPRQPLRGTGTNY